MKSINKITIWLLTTLIGLMLVIPTVSAAQVNVTNNNQTNTGSRVERVAPGESLPILDKLSNFGGGKRVDVLIKHEIITRSNQIITSATETVAVETTASFVTNVQIPSDAVSGTYTAKTSIVYQGQLTPASSQFTFTVEDRIFGVFQSDFYLFGGIAILAGVILVFLSSIIIKRIRAVRFAPLNYKNIAKSDRTYYEILSDTIMQMRIHVGDDALIVASNIKGLQIDKKTGRVLSFTENPSKVIATLVSEYEKQFDKKVSFSLLREKIN